MYRRPLVSGTQRFHHAKTSAPRRQGETVRIHRNACVVGASLVQVWPLSVLSQASSAPEPNAPKEVSIARITTKAVKHRFYLQSKQVNRVFVTGAFETL